MQHFALIPIRIDTLFLARGITCVGQDIAFEQLPYFDAKLGIERNADRPYIAEAVVATPFQSDTDYLKAGLHLHWALPDFLTTTRYGGEAGEFPAVPNRWYVGKEIWNENKKAWETPKRGVHEWVVESDYIWQDDEPIPYPDVCQTALDVDPSIGRPFAYLGRRFSLAEWETYQKSGKNQPERYWKAHNQGEALTSLGWGSLAFDTFYPNCKSVFGLHDTEVIRLNPAEKLRYTVLGWYQNTNPEGGPDEDDAVCLVVQGLRKEFARFQADATLDTQSMNEADFLRTRFQEVLHLHLPEGAPLPEDGMLCYGSVEIAAYIPSLNPAHPVELAIAPTPSETISAFLSTKLGKAEEDVIQKMKREEQFEAVILGDELSSLKLDLAPRLRELRHQKGFVRVEGGKRWKVQWIEERQLENAPILPKMPPPKKGHKHADHHHAKHHAQALKPSLPPRIRGALEQLNKAQRRYNRMSADLESMMTALYADWNRYIFCCYPPEGETEVYPDQDEAARFIRTQTLAHAKHLRQKLGIYPLGKLSDLEEKTLPASSLARKVAKAYRIVNLAISYANEKLPHPSSNYWQLQQDVGTDYWEIAPPSLLLYAKKINPSAEEANLAFSPVAPSKRFGQTNRMNDESKFLCKVLAWQSTNDQGFPRPDAPEFTTLKAELARALPSVAEHANLWHPFKLEWMVEVFPLANGSAAQSEYNNFEPDFITQNFELPEGEADLSRHAKLETTLAVYKAANVYQGSSFFVPNAEQAYISKIKAFGAKLPEKAQRLMNEATDLLSEYDMMSFSLGGFAQTLLQTQTIPTFRPSDPLAFGDYKSFTEEIAAFLSETIKQSSNPVFEFLPICSGVLKVLKIRLIDTFGRTYDLNPQSVVTSTTHTLPAHPDWVRLAPRLSQPATMHLDWVQNREEETALIEERLEELAPDSPICGWIIPNILDKNLMFFDERGKHVGNINPRGEWERDVFHPRKGTDTAPPSESHDVITSNEHLTRVVKWLIQKQAADASFMNTFILETTTAQEKIHPEAENVESIVSVLTGRPMAIVQAKVSLQLKGKPAFDMSWNAFFQDFRRGYRETNRFTQIQFPYRLGDAQQVNDSVIGYWKQDDQKQLEDTFWVNHAVVGTLNPEKAKAAIPQKLQHEAASRLRESHQNIALYAFLETLYENATLSRQRLIEAYFANGSKIWDVLVAEEWIKLTDTHRFVRSSDLDKTSCAVADPPQVFTLLVNPTGAVHLTSGILPVKELSLEEDLYKEALKNIEITFFTTPVLAPKSGVQLPLPIEEKYEWSWLQAYKVPPSLNVGKHLFKRTLHRPHFQKTQFVEAFSMSMQFLPQQIAHFSRLMEDVPDAETAWQHFIAEGWLVENTRYPDAITLITAPITHASNPSHTPNFTSFANFGDAANTSDLSNFGSTGDAANTSDLSNFGSTGDATNTSDLSNFDNSGNAGNASDFGNSGGLFSDTSLAHLGTMGGMEEKTLVSEYFAFVIQSEVEAATAAYKEKRKDLAPTEPLAYHLPDALLEMFIGLFPFVVQQISSPSDRARFFGSRQIEIVEGWLALKTSS